MSDMDEDGNYEDFMASDDESLQMEFESDEDEEMLGKTQENVNIQLGNEVVNNGNDNSGSLVPDLEPGRNIRNPETELIQLILSGESLMNNGKWDEARCQFSVIIELQKANAKPHSLANLFPIWMNLMNCWSRNLHYNTNEIDDKLLFADCHQFADFIYWRLQETTEHKLPENELLQLQQLINNILPVLTRQYMFEINEINLLELQKKVRLQLNLCQELENLKNVNYQIHDLLIFKRDVGRQWERIITISMTPESGAHNICNLIDLTLFENLVKGLLNAFNSGIIKNKSFEQNLIIRQLGVLFQLYILAYSIEPSSNLLQKYDLLMTQLLAHFGQYSNELLILSQDSSLMLLFHLSFSIQTLISNSENDLEQWAWIETCRHHFLSTLQQVERIGSYDHSTSSEYYQFVFIGFILTSIFIILADYDNDNKIDLEQNKILNPFEYEQIKLIGKNETYRTVIVTLQKFYERLMKLDLCNAYREIRIILHGHVRLLNQFELLNKESFNKAMKLKFRYKVIPVYDRISISDLQQLLNYDALGTHALTRDDLITLLMELELDNNKNISTPQVASFKIDFVKDHVLLFNGPGCQIYYERQVFAENGNNTFTGNIDHARTKDTLTNLTNIQSGIINNNRLDNDVGMFPHTVNPSCNGMVVTEECKHNNNATQDLSTANFFMCMSEMNGDTDLIYKDNNNKNNNSTIDTAQRNRNQSNVATTDEDTIYNTMQLQLQAAQLVSLTLSANSVASL